MSAEFPITAHYAKLSPCTNAFCGHDHCAKWREARSLLALVASLRADVVRLSGENDAVKAALEAYDATRTSRHSPLITHHLSACVSAIAKVFER